MGVLAALLHALLLLLLLLLRAGLYLSLYTLQCSKCIPVDVNPARVTRLAQKYANDAALPI
jgi:hypothetical protein